MKEILITDSFNIMSNNAEEIAFHIGTALLEGEIDPVQMAVFLKKMEKVSALLFKSTDISDAIYRAFHGEKTCEAYGAYIQEGILHSKYDYASAGDLEYNALLEIEKDIKERKKEIEALLRTIHGSRTMVYEKLPVLEYKDSGEMVDVKEISKSITRGYKFTV